MKPQSYPLSLLALIVSIAAVNLFAEIYYWYWRIRWFDMPMHFLGGMWLAGTGLWLVYTRRGTPLPRFSVIFAVGVIFALGVGFLWEVFEAGLSLRTLGHINAMPDTLGDLFFDAVGSAMFSVWAWFSIKNN